MVASKAADVGSEAVRERARKALERIILPPAVKGQETCLVSIAHRSTMSDLLEVVDQLLLQPDKVAVVKRLVFREDLAAVGGKRGRADETEPWPDQYSVWGRIPAYWLWSWVQTNYSEFQDNIITSLQKADKHCIRKLIEYSVGIREKQAVDSRLRCKRAMSRFLLTLAADRGHRLRGWVTRAFGDGCSIQWNLGGAWAWGKVAEGRVLTATYGNAEFTVSARATDSI
jgi:hypothetical protein